jgi:hypothetical protein
MRRLWFGLGLLFGSVAYPGGVILGHVLFRRSVIYPH